MAPLPAALLSIAIGYGCGSIPSGLWLGRALRGVDVRMLGSGNLGATNVYRSLGRGIGVATRALDVLNGAAPTWLVPRTALGAAFPGGVEWCALAVGTAAVLGHVWTFLAGVRGGKGVATAGGVVLALDPIAMLICVALFVALVAITRFISVGSMVAAAAFPVVVALQPSHGPRDPLFGAAIVLAALLILRHRDNLARLSRGEERRFSLAGRKSA